MSKNHHYVNDMRFLKGKDMTLRLTSSAFALAAMTMPAFADVTAEQVWQAWVDYYQATGYTVTEGSRDLAGETLTLRDVVFSFNEPQSGHLTFTVPQIALHNTGDGKVRTVYADTLSGTYVGPEATEPDAADAADEQIEADFSARLPDNEIVTSGTVEAMTHEFTYPTLVINLDRLKSGDTEMTKPMEISLENNTGTMETVAGDLKKYAYAVKSEKLGFKGDFQADADESLTFDGSVAGLEASGNFASKTGMFGNDADMNAALKEGLDLQGTLKAGAAVTNFTSRMADETGAAQQMSGKSDAKGFELSFAMSQDGLVYQGGSDAMTAELQVPQFPFPLSYGIESGTFDLQIPVMKSDEAQPFKIAYALTNLTLSDDIWNLFDAQKILPRDPASLELDVTGKADVHADLLDEAAQEAMESPFMPSQVSLNRLALNLLGAKAEATGELSAPEDGDITTPVGTIKARYENLNGLLDNLGKTGFIPADQLTGLRMMLAMFAKVDANDPNVQTTDIEFKEGGAIFANGQQIQ